MSILDLVDNQNGTFYDDNYNRCSVLDELGKQYLLVRNFNTPSTEIVPIMVDDGHGNFVFQTFYDKLRDRGFVIYPGKLTVADSFRIGCIGRIGETEMRAFLEAVKAVMTELNVKSGAPRTRAAE